MINQSCYLTDLIPSVIRTAFVAGNAIMGIYESDEISVEQKSDNSPLTLADRLANEEIVKGLESIGDYPVLSEEGQDIPWEIRRSWKKYWLVDPLDGTKEFIKRNGEFTVNIALVDQGRPILGVVYAPAKKLLYFATVCLGAFKLDVGSKSEKNKLLEIENSLPTLMRDSQKLQVMDVPSGEVPWRVVGSRSHQSDDFKDFVKRLPKTEIVAMGSSLKLCMVAEGTADLYPRLGLTSEWDTAAAQAIVEASGGLVLNADTGGFLRYNEKESLLNPFFIVCADRSSTWEIL